MGQVENSWKRFGLGILLLVMIAVWGFVWAVPLMFAWNYVMPDIFGLGTISYLQMWSFYLILASLWRVSIIGVMDN